MPLNFKPISSRNTRFYWAVAKFAKVHRYDIYEDVSRGKGSERTFYHPRWKNGHPVFHTVKCHGEGTQLSIGVIESVRRAFNLSEEEFYE